MNRLITRNMLKVSIICIFAISALSSNARAQAYPAEWDSLRGAPLRALADNCFKGINDAPDIEVFKDFAYSKLISDPVVLRTLDKFDVQVISWACNGILSSADKQVWASHIKEVCASSQDEFSNNSFSDSVLIAEALAFIGDNTGASMLNVNINASADLPVDMKYLSRSVWCVNKLGADGEAALAKIANHVVSNVICSSSAINSTSIKRWHQAIWLLRDKFSYEDKIEIVKQLRETFAGDDIKLAAMSSKDFVKLTDICNWLGDSELSSLMVAREQSDTLLSSDDPEELWKFVHRVQSYASGIEDTRPALAARIIGKYEALSEERSLTWFECCLASKAYDLSKNRLKTQEMAESAFSVAMKDEASRQAVSMFDLHLLCWTMQSAGLFEDNTYPEITDMVVRFAQEGQFDNDSAHQHLIRFLGEACKGERARSLIAAQMTDGDGNVRYPLTELLSWASRDAKVLKAWEKELEMLADSEGASGENKALLLLARAYAESLEVYEPAPLRGLKWLELALSMNSSAKTKLKIAKTITDGYQYIGRHDKALVYLDTIKDQLSGADISGWADQINENRELRAYLDSERAAKIKEQHASKRLVELNARLDTARDKNDLEAIERYERLLAP